MYQRAYTNVSISNTGRVISRIEPQGVLFQLIAFFVIKALKCLAVVRPCGELFCINKIIKFLKMG